MAHRHSRLHALLAGVAAAAVSTAAMAQEKQFNIPPQSLASALNQFGAQSDTSVLVRPDLTGAKTTRGVSGAADVEVALRDLLAGTGLAYQRDGATFLIVQSGEGGSSPQGAGADVDALIVTAQKREENIQDVPIAISAFSQAALEEQKIEGGFDLLKGIPNVTFSKSNYSGYNFSIRGVGTKAVSATTDPGVAVSFNSVSLIRNRLFEQEYLDVERVEVLRGPQGTLYGRNATAGVINLVTAKPDLDQFEGRVKGEVGNYDARRMSGFVNLPILEDVLGLRVAGAFTQRDGYGFNTATNDSVDGRDLWTSRVSLAYEPADWLRADLVWERFEEDDNRLRTGKQLCHRDPGPETFPGYGPLNAIMQGRLSQGCKPGSLYEAAAFGAPNGLSIPFVVAAQTMAEIGYDQPRYFPDETLNPAANMVTFMNPGVDPYGVEQSRDLRTISSLRDAQYRAKADIFALDLELSLSDSLTLTSQTLYNKDEVYSFQDYNRFATKPSFNDSAPIYHRNCGFPIDETWDSYGHCDDRDPLWSVTPGGVFTDPQIGPANTLAGFEISSSDSKQFSQDLRIQSDFDGPVNFSAGANYLRFKGLNDYYLFFNVVTLMAQGFYNRSPVVDECTGGAGAGNCMAVDPNPIESLSGDGHNYFRNKNPYKLESKSLFGEVYWDVADSAKLTAGLRYTDDRKSFTPWRSQLLVPGYDYGPSDPLNQRWTEVTGRLGVDWKPELSLTDETMVYAFYSRGYKGGGANPPSAVPTDPSTVVSEVPATFAPEFVDAFEIGAKNVLMGGALVLNGAAFFYDYQDYQVSKVVDRTIVNENFDAKVWGVELETIWRPTADLRINATLGYLDTRIADGEKSIDIFDRTQGHEGWSVLTPWLQQTSNCVLPDDVTALLLSMGLLPGNLLPFSPILRSCVLYSEAFYVPEIFEPADFPEVNNGAGFYDDLSGNELPNAPHWTFNIGAQYSWNLLSGWDATVRGDYYRQSQSFARVYNSVADKLRGWDNLNLSLRIERPEDDLTFELYAKNVFDETPITDAFLNSDSTGMTTNVFTLDPRLIGVSVTKGF